MEENKEVMNTEQAGSGGMLYGTEPQPQEELHGISAAYSTEMQAQPSELPQPIPVQQPIAPQQQPAPPFNPGWSGQPPQQGSYYQQGSGQPMNNPPMGFGPVQTPPPVQGAPVPRQKKRRTGLIAGVLCAAAVAIFIVVGVLLSKALFGGGGAKAQLAKGFANMAMETAAYRSAVAEDLSLIHI